MRSWRHCKIQKPVFIFSFLSFIFLLMYHYCIACSSLPYANAAYDMQVLCKEKKEVALNLCKDSGSLFTLATPFLPHLTPGIVYVGGDEGTQDGHGENEQRRVHVPMQAASSHYLITGRAEK